MISNTAIVSPHAKLGSNITVGNYSIIKDHVVIGDNSVIGDFCLLGEPVNNADKPLIIGKNAYIRSHTILYAATTIGNDFVCGHNVHVREETVIGNYCQLGSNSELQGNLTIGNYTKTQSNVFISKFSKVSDYVWMLPYVSLLNDKTPPSKDLKGPTINEFAVLCANSSVLPGVNVASGTVLGAGALLTSNTKPNGLYLGHPAKFIKSVNEIYGNSGKSAYPWIRNFDRDYPLEMLEKFKAINGK